MPNNNNQIPLTSLNLLQITSGDNIQTMVDKINHNISQLAINGGGAQGIPGKQGIPGVPGLRGRTGEKGDIPLNPANFYSSAPDTSWGSIYGSGSVSFPDASAAIQNGYDVGDVILDVNTGVFYEIVLNGTSSVFEPVNLPAPTINTNFFVETESDNVNKSYAKENVASNLPWQTNVFLNRPTAGLHLSSISEISSPYTVNFDKLRSITNSSIQTTAKNDIYGKSRLSYKFSIDNFYKYDSLYADINDGGSSNIGLFSTNTSEYTPMMYFGDNIVRTGTSAIDQIAYKLNNYAILLKTDTTPLSASPNQIDRQIFTLTSKSLSSSQSAYNVIYMQSDAFGSESGLFTKFKTDPQTVTDSKDFTAFSDTSSTAIGSAVNHSLWTSISVLSELNENNQIKKHQRLFGIEHNKRGTFNADKQYVGDIHFHTYGPVPMSAPIQHVQYYGGKFDYQGGLLLSDNKNDNHLAYTKFTSNAHVDKLGAANFNSRSYNTVGNVGNSIRIAFTESLTATNGANLIMGERQLATNNFIARPIVLQPESDDIVLGNAFNNHFVVNPADLTSHVPNPVTGMNRNVGIGQVNPGSKLSVLHNISVGNTYSTLSAPRGGIIAETSIGISDSDPISSGNTGFFNAGISSIPLNRYNNSKKLVIGQLTNENPYIVISRTDGFTPGISNTVLPQNTSSGILFANDYDTTGLTLTTDELFRMAEANRNLSFANISANNSFLLTRRSTLPYSVYVDNLIGPLTVNNNTTIPVHNRVNDIPGIPTISYNDNGVVQLGSGKLETNTISVSNGVFSGVNDLLYKLPFIVSRFSGNFYNFSITPGQAFLGYKHTYPTLVVKQSVYKEIIDESATPSNSRYTAPSIQVIKDDKPVVFSHMPVNGQGFRGLLTSGVSGYPRDLKYRAKQQKYTGSKVYLNSYNNDLNERISYNEIAGSSSANNTTGSYVNELEGYPTPFISLTYDLAYKNSTGTIPLTEGGGTSSGDAASNYKINTIIQAGIDTASRTYLTPQGVNRGGTFMVFSDEFAEHQEGVIGNSGEANTLGINATSSVNDFTNTGSFNDKWNVKANKDYRKDAITGDIDDKILIEDLEILEATSLCVASAGGNNADTSAAANINHLHDVTKLQITNGYNEYDVYKDGVVTTYKTDTAYPSYFTYKRINKEYVMVSFRIGICAKHVYEATPQLVTNEIDWPYVYGGANIAGSAGFGLRRFNQWVNSAASAISSIKIKIKNLPTSISTYRTPAILSDDLITNLYDSDSQLPLSSTDRELYPYLTDDPITGWWLNGTCYEGINAAFKENANPTYFKNAGLYRKSVLQNSMKFPSFIEEYTSFVLEAHPSANTMQKRSLYQALRPKSAKMLRIHGSLSQFDESDNNYSHYDIVTPANRVKPVHDPSFSKYIGMPTPDEYSYVTGQYTEGSESYIAPHLYSYSSTNNYQWTISPSTTDPNNKVNEAILHINIPTEFVSTNIEDGGYYVDGGQDYLLSGSEMIETYNGLVNPYVYNTRTNKSSYYKQIEQNFNNIGAPVYYFTGNAILFSEEVIPQI